MNRVSVLRTVLSLFVGASLSAAVATAQAAEIIVVPGDAPGFGFFDPTPVAPVGGNPGTTLGEQRLNVFLRAAQIWGANLNSQVPVSVIAFFDPLPCTATSAVLGSAGPLSASRDFPGAERANTWYVAALANKLAGVDLDPPPPNSDGSDLDIVAFFNRDLGLPGCLEGSGFYLGLDGNGPANLDNLLSTVLHEFGHGLGFLTLTSSATGNYFGSVGGVGGFPTIYDHFAFDNTTNKLWVEMTAAERQQSAINPRQLVWTGERVTARADNVLDNAREIFLVTRQQSRVLDSGPAQFGPQVDARRPIAEKIGQVVDQPSGLGLACEPLSAANASAVRGNIALIDRGVCAFTIKVKNAQNAGAKAVMIADNTAALPPGELAGTDPTITIPSARISQADGVAIKQAIAASGVGAGGRISFFRPSAVFYENIFRLAGADYHRHVTLYTPNPRQPGSSVSHWDTLAKPNLLMEPFSTTPPVLSVAPPNDLSRPFMRDIGW